jgi:hypothetical protein
VRRARPGRSRGDRAARRSRLDAKLAAVALIDRASRSRRSGWCEPGGHGLRLRRFQHPAVGAAGRRWLPSSGAGRSLGCEMRSFPPAHRSFSLRTTTKRGGPASPHDCIARANRRVRAIDPPARRSSCRRVSRAQARSCSRLGAEARVLSAVLASTHSRGDTRCCGGSSHGVMRYRTVRYELLPSRTSSQRADPSALRAEGLPAGAPRRRARGAAVARRASCWIVTNGDGDDRLGATEGADRARRRERRDRFLARDADPVNRFDVARQDATATVVSVGARGHGIAGLCRRRPIADGPRSLARDDRAAHLATEAEPPR